MEGLGLRFRFEGLGDLSKLKGLGDLSKLKAVQNPLSHAESVAMFDLVSQNQFRFSGSLNQYESVSVIPFLVHPSWFSLNDSESV